MYFKFFLKQAYFVVLIALFAGSLCTIEGFSNHSKDTREDEERSAKRQKKITSPASYQPNQGEEIPTLFNLALPVVATQVEDTMLPFLSKPLIDEENRQKIVTALENGASFTQALQRIQFPDLPFADTIVDSILPSIAPYCIKTVISNNGNTFLHWAANKPALMKELLSYYPHPFLPNYNGVTPLQLILIHCLNESYVAEISKENLLVKIQDMLKQEYGLNFSELFSISADKDFDMINELIPADFAQEKIHNPTLFQAVASIDGPQEKKDKILSILKTINTSIINLEISPEARPASSAALAPIVDNIILGNTSAVEEVIKTSPKSILLPYSSTGRNLFHLTLQYDLPLDMMNMILDAAQRVAFWLKPLKTKDLEGNTPLHVGAGSLLAQQLIKRRIITLDIINSTNYNKLTPLALFVCTIFDKPSEAFFKTIEIFVKGGGSIEPSGHQLNLTELQNMSEVYSLHWELIPYFYYVLINNTEIYNKLQERLKNSPDIVEEDDLSWFVSTIKDTNMGNASNAILNDMYAYLKNFLSKADEDKEEASSESESSHGSGSEMEMDIDEVD